MSADPARALPAISPVSEPAAEAGAPHLPAPHGVIQEPPKAMVRPVAHRNHADIRIDEYGWLRNREDPEVLEYLEQENRYTDAVMRPTEELQTRCTRRCGPGSRRPISRCPSRSTTGCTTRGRRPGPSTRSIAAGG